MKPLLPARRAACRKFPGLSKPAFSAAIRRIADLRIILRKFCLPVHPATISDRLLDLFGSGDCSAWAEVFAQNFVGRRLIPEADTVRNGSGAEVGEMTSARLPPSVICTALGFYRTAGRFQPGGWSNVVPPAEGVSPAVSARRVGIATEVMPLRDHIVISP